MTTVHTLIVAAGVGSRFGGDTPKQYTMVDLSDFGIDCRQTVLESTVSALSRHGLIDRITLVVAKNDTVAKNLNFAVPVTFVEGGKERFDSVKNGLNYITKTANPDDYVLIHDAARPCVPYKDLAQIIDFTLNNKPVGAILATPVADTLKRAKSVDDVPLPIIDTTVGRSQLWQALTPQVFHLKSLINAIDALDVSQKTITDEASIFDTLASSIHLIQGSRANIKLTYPTDLPMIQALLASQYICST